MDGYWEGYVIHIWNDIAKKHLVSYVIAMVSGISEIHTCANAGVNSGLLKGSRFMIKLYQLCRLYLCVYSFSRKAGIYPGTENTGFAFFSSFILWDMAFYGGNIICQPGLKDLVRLCLNLYVL